MDSPKALPNTELYKVRPDEVKRGTIVGYCALAALILLCCLACLAPVEKVDLADRVALFFLAAMIGVMAWTPLFRTLEEQPGALTFALTAVMFVVYSLSRRYVGENSWSIRFSAMPEDAYVIPYSAYIAVLGAIIALPLCWINHSGWLRSLLTGFALVGIFSAFAFWLLSRYFPVGVTEMVDPSPLPNLLFLLIEYASVGLLCRAVTADTYVRRHVLRFLPFVLLILWARFQFFGMPPEETE